MMQGLLLCCLVALAASQTSGFELGLKQRLVYEYEYEGRVDFGLARINRPESGVRIKCKLKISVMSAQTHALQVIDLTFEEFNGIPEKDSHVTSTKISKRLADQLAKPIVFDFSDGHISNIQASEGVSDTAINIVRGMLSCFHATVKPNHRVYGLKEVSIHGNCHTNYVIERDAKGTKVTQEVDINDCSEKAELYSGMATAVLDKVSKQKGDSVASTMTTTFSLKMTAHEILNRNAFEYIENVTSQELQYFSSFNVKGGTLRMKAEKKMNLLGRTYKVEQFEMGPMEPKGDITHKIIEANVFLPIVMQDLSDPYSKALKLIEGLADANKYSLNKNTTVDSIKVYQLLRLLKYEELGKMWNALKDKDEQRRWFLDLVAEVNDARIVKFLKDRYLSGDMSVIEAVQVHMLAISHLSATSELVEMAKDFFELPFCKKNQFMRQTVMFTYGSLVYRHCAYNTSCGLSAVQPLLTEARNSLRGSDENRMITVLKALGNAGYVNSIKEIMKFLPKIGANTQGRKLSTSVIIAAVDSLRLIAARDPDSVQDIAFKVFTEKSFDARVRIHAFLMLFEAKPPLSLVIRVSSLLLSEEDTNVGSTAYFYLKRLARSSTPDNLYLSTACSVAVKMLTPKFGRHSNGYDQALRVDWFNDNFLIGTAAEAFMLRSAADAVPSELRMRTKFFFIGRILELLELGVEAEEIQKLFSSTGKDTDFNALLKKILNWEDVPNNKTVFSVYTRLSGQELFFLDIKKKWIQTIIQHLWPSAGKDSTLEVIRLLQKKHDLKFAKTFLTAEARYFQATSLGLQAEIAKYYLSTNALRVDASTTVNPPLQDDLGNLLSCDVSLKTEGSLEAIKDIWVYFGVNTDLFQVGSELRSKAVLSLPWNIDASLNFKDWKFEIDIAPLEKAFEVACVRSDVYAINRNIDGKAKEASLIPRFSRTMTEARPVLEANDVYWKRRDCTGSKIYGVEVCAISDIQRRYYHEEYPLYYFMGFTHMAIEAVKVDAVKPIKKIRLEYSSKFKKDPPSTRQLLETLRSFSEEVNGPSSSEPEYGNSDALTAIDPVALVSFKVLALNNGPRPEGYQGHVYPNSELIVSSVGVNISKRICVNYKESTLYDAKAKITFGHECQPYSLSVRAVTTPKDGFLLPESIKTYLNWEMIPDSIAKLGRRIGSYIPGMAVLSGFSETPENNVEKEVVSTVTVASADSIGVELKLPKHTMCHRAIPFPMPLGNSTRNMRLDDL